MLIHCAFQVVLLLPVLVQDHSPVLRVPARSVDAPEGSAFVRSIMGASLVDRERAIVEQIKAGNLPPYLRELAPVTIARDGRSLTFYVAPDYLAVGSDADNFLTPLSPSAAQTIADSLDCILPTTKMVDAIHAQASVRVAPSPIPPSPAMTTVPAFQLHHAIVLSQRAGFPLGRLTAGHKKDVVITDRVFSRPGKVAIYGWHELDGRPIQPLYTGHSDRWVDYSHGIRLVSRWMVRNGERIKAEEVLGDPEWAELLSDDGPMTSLRYPPMAAEPSSTVKIAADAERLEWATWEPGVRIAIHRPKMDSKRPVLLVIYALPNGNTIEQTFGRRTNAADDWRYEIQHIGAQTRFLRQKIRNRSIVVAYLENDLKSWPAWRRKHGDAALSSLVDTLRKPFERPDTRLVLSGHSGGGAMILGYLNQLQAIPEFVERIAFLDANYAYETERHRDKLISWLNASNQHALVVLAYNDAVALLNGKAFVSASGGTWGRSRQMLADLESTYRFHKDSQGSLSRVTALDGRITFLLRENPERAIFHTVQVERNGFIESLLAGTDQQEAGYRYFGERAYSQYLEGP